eukprot:326175-Amphidinium_carterae.1
MKIARNSVDDQDIIDSFPCWFPLKFRPVSQRLLILEKVSRQITQWINRRSDSFSGDLSPCHLTMRRSKKG